MTIQELEKQIKVLQEEIEKLKVVEKKSSRWKPKFNETYWYIDDCGEVVYCTWCNDLTDIWRYNNIPIFKTQEECMKYKKFKEDVLAHSYEFSEKEWSDIKIYKHSITYDVMEKTMEVDFSVEYKDFNKIYFKTEEDAQYIIDNYSEELKKWRV